MLFGLAGSLERVFFDALRIGLPSVIVEFPKWPSSDQSLVEKVFIVSRRRGMAIDQVLLAAIPIAPATQVKKPHERYLGQHVDAGTDVFGTFGIMRRTGQHRIRPTGKMLVVGTVKFLGGRAEVHGIASDLVQRH